MKISPLKQEATNETGSQANREIRRCQPLRNMFRTVSSAYENFQEKRFIDSLGPGIREDFIAARERQRQREQEEMERSNHSFHTVSTDADEHQRD